MVPMGIPDRTTLTERSLEDRMPYVNIKVTREGVTAEQKARLIKGTTDLLVEVLGKKPATIFVVIDEVDTDNWGVAGESITVRRNRGQ
jgi:4-oxalocrotonate tautomerase